MLLCRQMLRKSLLKMHLTPNMYKIITLKANAQKIIYCKMHLTPNMYKNVTLKANAKEIIT